MTLMTIILNECWKDIYNRLDHEMDFFLKDGIIIDKNIEKIGRETYISYSVEETCLKYYTIDEFEHIFKYYIANIFSEIIIHDMEEKMAYDILSNEYDYFGLQERKAILKHFNNIQKDEMYKYEKGSSCTISRRTKIVQQMMDYFIENDVIHLEGFLRFRLRSYIEELENSIDRAVEDFLMEKEYNEFIRLLRYFVDIQEAKIDTVNVLMTEDGNYQLYDDKNKMIKNEYLEDLALEMADKDISYDDLLISSLITLAPKKIIIHFSTNSSKKEIIDTIQNVFSDRVYICTESNLCGSIHNLKQE
ncbi:putative sporulation protein YtxC [Crassaminicella profunda]|uniref:putative sporulation protein YtxC n=1 Tax=Crassaminicella profunda TaxID=1286698 RepID=UPI001CA60168|nr:putative sporulation protein YtxC [Crassaminicella profunda]QZY56292.1 putative sporulation protein YtxC [Crassaminicella profunda]